MSEVSRRPDDLSRLIAKLQRTVSDLGKRASRIGHVHELVAFDSESGQADTGLTTSFQTVASLTFTPPAGWNTYRLQGEVFAVVAGLTSGDVVQLGARIDGVAPTLYADNAASTARTLIAYNEATGLSGAIVVDARINNATASRGTKYTAGVRVTAVRES